MARKWGEVRKQLSAEREARVRRRVQEELVRLSLQQLRSARNLTQENLARTLNIKQSAVSRLEQRTDMYVSTLRSYLKAMGAELQVKAVFPDGEVEIEQFEEIEARPKRAMSAQGESGIKRAESSPPRAELGGSGTRLYNHS